MEMINFTNDMVRAIMDMRNDTGMTFSAMEDKVSLGTGVLSGWTKSPPKHIRVSSALKLFNLINPYLNKPEEDERLFKLVPTEDVSRPMVVDNEAETDECDKPTTIKARFSTETTIGQIRNVKQVAQDVIRLYKELLEACEACEIDAMNKAYHKIIAKEIN